jgi:hypothetical protein
LVKVPPPLIEDRFEDRTGFCGALELFDLCTNSLNISPNFFTARGEVMI